MMNLVNALNGYQYVLKTLKRIEGYDWNNIIGVNYSETGTPRYHIAIGDSGCDNILIKFSREPYKSGSNGFRESLNKEYGIKECIRKNIKRVFWIYPNGHIYWIKLNNFLIKGEKRETNNEKKEVYTILLKELVRYNGGNKDEIKV